MTPAEHGEVFDEFIDEVLNEPAPAGEAASQKPREQHELQRVLPVISSPVYVRPGRRMERTLPVVTAVRVIGSGLLQDLSKVGRDIFGGRATTVEGTLATQLEQLRREVAKKAVEAKAQAVVSYSVEVGTIGTGLTILIATGTPVVLMLIEEGA